MVYCADDQVTLHWTTVTTERHSVTIPKSEFDEIEDNLEDGLGEYENDGGIICEVTRENIDVTTTL